MSPSFALQGLYLIPTALCECELSTFVHLGKVGFQEHRGALWPCVYLEVKAMESLSHSVFLNMLAHLFQGFHIPWEVVLSKVNFKVKQILVHLAVCPMCFL